MNIVTPQAYAQALLQTRHYTFLLETRDDIYAAIEINRQNTIHENEVVRVDLRENIERIGTAIEDARASNAPQYVIDVLVEQVQMFNRARHTNRVNVKTLAFEQSVNKAMLAEVSREISYIEAELDYEDAMNNAYGDEG